MICAIHQPQFLPWLGYLAKISAADTFVFLDDVQFKKNEFQNRNKILVNGEARWITVPVSFDFGDPLNRVRIAPDKPWQRKMRNTIELNYRRAPRFREHEGGLFDLLQRGWNSLAELNEASVRWLIDAFGIDTDLTRSSDMVALTDDPTQRLVDICRNVGADTYLSGSGGRNYLDTTAFADAGITLEFQNFLHPEYPQCYTKSTDQGEFVSHLSSIDGLFNCGGGAQGREVLRI